MYDLWWSWIPALGIAVLIMSWRLGLIIRNEFPPKDQVIRPGRLERWSLLSGNRATWIAVLATMVGAYILGASPRLAVGALPSWMTFVIVWFLFMLLQVIGGFRVCFLRTHKRHGNLGAAALIILISTVCAAVTTAGMIGLWEWLDSIGAGTAPLGRRSSSGLPSWCWSGCPAWCCRSA